MVVQNNQDIRTPMVVLTSHNHEDAPLLPSRVKVSFYECQKPNWVTTPESPDIPLDFLNLSNAMSTPTTQAEYERQQSTESGLDNPFRPDGELSREADTIVSLIKEGKPITPVKGEPDGGGYFGSNEDEVDACVSEREGIISPNRAKGGVQQEAMIGKGHEANGNAPKDKPPQHLPGLVEVQHGIVVPPASTEVEQVIIKKKPKCKCCVIQ